MICKICNKNFKNNKSGILTKHLLETHNITYEKYVVMTEFDNIYPKCKCGFCNDIPLFHRGKFRMYAKGHNKYEWHKKKYIEKYGYPTCENCNKVVDFYRKKPRRFCSHKCSGKIVGGFNNKNTQNKINNSIYTKYGVIRTSALDINKNKQSKRCTGKNNPFYGKTHSVENKNIISMKMKNKWKNDEYKKKVSGKIKITLNNKKNKLKRSKLMKRRWASGDISYEKLFKNLKTRHSKLHTKINEQLNLKNLGFISEQIIDRYVVDEINYDKKIIIEINGNYIHANPKIYNKNYIIKLPGNSYLAGEKWKSDKKKINKLKRLGYKVLVIWESDDIYLHNKKLNKLLI